MDTIEFLAHLNTSTKQWGLWINRDCPIEHHVGHYAFEHDDFPRSYLHVGTLEELAHLRQRYILENFASNTSEEELSHQWAKRFLAEWQTQCLATA